MAAVLRHPSVVNDEDLVGVAHGGQAVGDDNDGASGGQAGQGLVDVALGGGVGLGGGLVQDQDGGVLEVGAGQGDPLALAPGEEPARLAQDRVVAVGQARNALVDAGGPGRRLHLLAGGPGPAQGDVVVHGVVGQGHVLQHDRHPGEQPGEGGLAHVDAGDAHGAGVDVVEAGNETGQGGLPAPGGTHQGGDGAGLGREGHALEHRGAGLVGEGDVIHLHPPRGGAVVGVEAALGHGRLGEQLGGVLGRHTRLVGVLHEVDERDHALGQPQGHQEEGQGGGQLGPALPHEEHRQGRHGGEHGGRAQHRRHEAHGPPRARDPLVGDVGEVPPGGVEAGTAQVGGLEALDLLNALDHLDGGGGQVRLRLPEAVGDTAQAAHGGHDGGQGQEPHPQQGQGQRPVGPQQVGRPRQGHDHGVGGVPGHVGHEGVDRGGVVAHHLAYGAVGDGGHAPQRQAAEGLHHTDPQVVAQPGLGQVGDAQAREVEQLGDEEGPDGDHRPRPGPGREPLGVRLLQPDGGQVPQSHEGHDGQHRPDGGQGAGEDHRPPRRPNEVADGDRPGPRTR